MSVDAAQPAVVIVGAGQAGLQSATSLREAGWQGGIQIVGDEPHLPYSRPMLSKDYLGGTATDEELLLRAEPYFARNAIELIPASAVAIDREAHALILHDGRAIPYEHLVLATGATPRWPPIEGSDLDGVVVLRDRDHATDLRDRLAAATSIVVIGGGFIGTEVASVAPTSTRVAILERDPRILRRVLSEEVARYSHRTLADRGVDIRTDVAITALSGSDGRVRVVQLANGSAIPADLVLIAAGAAPRVELAAAAGLEVHNGVVVDETLSTSDPRISAIGDCASFEFPFARGRVRLESVQNAVDQARHVADRIVNGTRQPYAAVPWFWTHQADDRIQIVGIAEDGDEAVVVPGTSDRSFTVYRVRDGHVAAVETVNAPRDHVRARRILADGPRPLADFGIDPGLAADSEAVPKGVHP